MILEALETAGQLHNFFETIYGDLEGFAYLAYKLPSGKGVISGQTNWRQEFFEYPKEIDRLVSRVREQSQKYEVYYGPSIYTKKSAKKINVHGSYVLWVEFDGNAPEQGSSNGIPQPSIIIRSSNPGHEHWYWLTDEILDVPKIERINKSLAYSLGSDLSGWDSTQILRPPETFNHKRQAEVKLVSLRNERVSLGDFHDLKEPPIPDNFELEIKEVPDVNDAIAKYKFKADVWILFKKGVPEGSRSEGLMALGYHLAEMQLKNEEILSLLLNADSRWGKFAGRSDQVQRLTQIVFLARGKYPLTDIDPVGKMATYGLHTLLKTNIQLEWVWDGLLQEAGYFLLTGPPGAGKTQFSLDFAQQVAQGKNFLERHIPKPRRIGFVSLEMGLVDLKYFVSNQSSMYSEKELELLEENLRFLPIGEPLYLSEKTEQDALEEWIYEEKLDGIIIDSLGSTTRQELSQEADVKAIMDYNDRLRQRHNLFTWYVHHHRKSSGDNKRPNKLDDVYGNRYITARATTVYCLWEGADSASLSGIPLKVRLAAKPPVDTIFRDGKLHFTTLNKGMVIEKKVNKKEKVEKDPNSPGAPAI